MTTLALKNSIPNYYPQNRGEQAEVIFRYTLTGAIMKADNIPATKSADILDIQIKSSHCTIANSVNLEEHLALDVAQRYAYVVKDFEKAFILSKNEWKEFVLKFSYVDYDSRTKKAKIRLRKENRAMISWLEENSNH